MGAPVNRVGVDHAEFTQCCRLVGYGQEKLGFQKCVPSLRKKVVLSPVWTWAATSVYSLEVDSMSVVEDKQ